MPIRERDRWRKASSTLEWFAHDTFWVQAMGRDRTGTDPRAAEGRVGRDPGGGTARGAPRSTLALHGWNCGLGAKAWIHCERKFHEPLLILLGVVGMALLMTCANLAGLLLAKATARRKEIALRLALGAGRSRVIRQLLVEGALLSAGGAVVGLLLAKWATDALPAMLATGQTAIAFEVHPDTRMLAFTAGIALLTTLLFGLVAGVAHDAVDLAHDIRQDPVPESGRSAVHAGTAAAGSTDCHRTSAGGGSGFIHAQPV